MGNSERIAQISTKDDGFLFDPATGDAFIANPTALAIVRALQEGGDEAAAVAALTDRYDVTAAEARRDVTELCARLRAWQLL